MKRTVYEAPVTELFRIELEGNFCASADVENPNDKENGKISSQEISDSFSSFDDTFGGGTWSNNN